MATDHGDSSPVRPTRPVLNSLGVAVPVADIPLHTIDHPIITKSQRLPEVVLAQGAERIACIRDRVWFKCKVPGARAAVTRLREVEVFPGLREVDDLLGRWWIGAAGVRQNDSGQHDFYAQLEDDVDRNGSSIHLLPSDWDEKRVKLELAALFEYRLRSAVCKAIALAVQRGRAVRIVAAHHYIQVAVSGEESDEAYLFVGAGGVYDPTIVAVMLASVPGVAPSDWQIEPSGREHGADPRSGEVVFSTMLTAEVIETLRTIDPAGLEDLISPFPE